MLCLMTEKVPQNQIVLDVRFEHKSEPGSILLAMPSSIYKGKTQKNVIKKIYIYMFENSCKVKQQTYKLQFCIKVFIKLSWRQWKLVEAEIFLNSYIKVVLSLTTSRILCVLSFGHSYRNHSLTTSGFLLFHIQVSFIFSFRTGYPSCLQGKAPTF